MTFVICLITIFLISLILAVRSFNEEMSVPESVKKIKIRKKKGLSGVIIFLKEKVVHYKSDEKT